jgi:hypothetical protein
VGRELYGFGRCSVLAITGVFKFLLPQNATKKESNEEVWNKYMKRLEKVKPPGTNIPKKRKRKCKGMNVNNL